MKPEWSPAPFLPAGKCFQSRACQSWHSMERAHIPAAAVSPSQRSHTRTLHTCTLVHAHCTQLWAGSGPRQSLSSPPTGRLRPLAGTARGPWDNDGGSSGSWDDGDGALR